MTSPPAPIHPFCPISPFIQLLIRFLTPLPQVTEQTLNEVHEDQ